MPEVQRTGTNRKELPLDGAIFCCQFRRDNPQLRRRFMAALARWCAKALTLPPFLASSMCGDVRPFDEERGGCDQVAHWVRPWRRARRPRRRASQHVPPSDDRSFHHRMPQARDGQSRLTWCSFRCGGPSTGTLTSIRCRKDAGAALRGRRGMAGSPLWGGDGSDVKRKTSANGEQQIYVDPRYARRATASLGLDPFRAKNDVLSIVATRTPSDLKAVLFNNDISGIPTTQGTFSQKHGYFEIRAKAPARPCGVAGLLEAGGPQRLAARGRRAGRPRRGARGSRDDDALADSGERQDPVLRFDFGVSDASD